jgi:pimeloyl-ACP methyl ester carboxylesterase
MELYDASIAHFLAGEPVTPDPSLPAGIRALLGGLAAPANLPFARELWASDGAPLVAQIDVPTLIVIGKKDIQVDWRADGERLQHAAAQNAQIEFLFPDDANHVLKHESRPRSELNAGNVLSSYNGPETTLDPDAMASITEWLVKRV